MRLLYKIVLGFISLYALAPLVGIGAKVSLGNDNPVDYRYRNGIASERKNIYEEPSTNSRVVGTLDPGVVVDTVASKKSGQKGVLEWYKVVYGGAKGWITDDDNWGKYNPNDFFADDIFTGVRWRDYVRAVRDSGKGSEKFYLDVLKEYEKPSRVSDKVYTSIETDAATVAATELARMRSRAAIPYLEEITGHNSTKEFHTALQALRGIYSR